MQGIIVTLLLLGVVVEAARERRPRDVGDNLLDESNHFFVNLTKSLGLNTSSMVNSPYSLHSALTQIITYAKGPTAEEMKVGLGLTNVPLDKISSVYNKLNRQIQEEDDSSDTQIMDHTLLVVCTYFTTVLHLSAVNGPDPTQAPPIMDNDRSCVRPEAIRSYLLSQTNDNIDLYLPDRPTKGTLLLITTMLVRAEWQDMFDRGTTYKHRFLSLDAVPHGSIMVDMMTDARLVMWKRDDKLNVDVVEVPLKGGNLGFYIVLPYENHGLLNVEQRLLYSGRTLSSLADGLKPTPVRLGIPKMRLYTQLNLKGSLSDLGMSRAFRRETADFSKITGYETLYLSDVIHVTAIVLNEEGISALADTPPRKEDNPAQDVLPAVAFIADHPFAFFIRHNHLGRVLISGRFTGQ